MTNRSKSTLALGILFILGCASNSQVPSESHREAMASQERWLHGLRHGQSMREVALPFSPDSLYFLDVYDDGTLYRYVHGMYPVTRVWFGLYFKADRLSALLVDQDAADFFRCEYDYRHRSDRRPRGRMKPTDAWIESRDALGREFDAALTRADPEKGSESSVIEAAAHLPLAAVATPIYGMYVLSGWAARDAREMRRATEALGKVVPGTTSEGELLRLLGNPQRKSARAGGEVWVYVTPPAFVGTAGGMVQWKEAGRLGAPGSPSAGLGNEACAEMGADG